MNGAISPLLRCLSGIAGAIVLGLYLSPAAAQLAPWQQPPGCQSPGADPLSVSPTSGSPASLASPEQWTGEQDEQTGPVFGLRDSWLSCLTWDAVHDHVWFRSEFLGWWTKGTPRRRF